MPVVGLNCDVGGQACQALTVLNSETERNSASQMLLLAHVTNDKVRIELHEVGMTIRIRDCLWGAKEIERDRTCH